MVNGGREPARALVCRLYRENLQVEVGGPVDARVDRRVEQPPSSQNNPCSVLQDSLSFQKVGNSSSKSMKSCEPVNLQSLQNGQHTGAGESGPELASWSSAPPQLDKN